MVQRIKEITYLRAFAALSIVLIHTTSLYVNSGIVGAVANQFPRYGSPIFVMISGFILYHIELSRPSPAYAHFFKHRFLKVAIPYLIWTIIYSTYSMRGQILDLSSIDFVFVLKTYLLNIAMGTGYVHLYFVLIMIQLYALFPLLKKCMERYTSTTLIFALLISSTFQIVIYIHRLNIITLPSIGIAYATLFPGWLVFFCLGIYLKIRLKQTVSFWQKRILLCALIWISLMALTMLEVQISPVNITLRPTVSFYGVATFFLFYSIFGKLKNKIPQKADQIIEWIANNSFFVYLVHPLILNLLVLSFKWEGYNGGFDLYAITVILTCLFIFVYDKVKSLMKGPVNLGFKPVIGKNHADSL